MEAEELSYGNYLLYNSKHICKVVGVKCSDGMPYVRTTRSGIYYLITDYSPIPLSPEILENNGFEKYELPNEVKTRLGVEFGHRLYINTASITVISGSLYIYKPYENWSILPIRINMNVSSVHQLQQAMCLAGINKELCIL